VVVVITICKANWFRGEAIGQTNGADLKMVLCPLNSCTVQIYLENLQGNFQPWRQHRATAKVDFKGNL
jgi:hypothetical protein